MLRKLLSACGCLCILGVISLIVLVNQLNRFYFARAPEDAAAETVTIAEGDRLPIDTLAEKGLVNKFWFKVYAKFSPAANHVQYGTFDVPHGISYHDLVSMLTVGNQKEVMLTIPEGFTLAQIGERVQENFSVTVEDWEAATGPDSAFEAHEFVVTAQKPDDVDLEGYLFPDTYRFFADATAEDIVEKLLTTMQERVGGLGIDLDALSERSGGEVSSMHDVLTLASVIEREVRTPDDMAMVADIFLKRLEIGMALQADSTVNYVTGGDDPSISLDDTRLDSPYNTYKYPGLPPGPISNPGLNALAAVATPASNDYYYFLTTDDGDAIYARTNDEHAANKARYLR